ATGGKGGKALMLRLPSFTYLQPRTLTEALAMKADAGPDEMYVAGGTDLYPNMKRRHQEPRTVISLMGIPELAGCEMQEAGCVVPAVLGRQLVRRRPRDGGAGRGLRARRSGRRARRAGRTLLSQRRDRLPDQAAR